MSELNVIWCRIDQTTGFIYQKLCCDQHAKWMPPPCVCPSYSYRSANVCVWIHQSRLFAIRVDCCCSFFSSLISLSKVWQYNHIIFSWKSYWTALYWSENKTRYWCKIIFSPWIFSLFPLFLNMLHNICTVVIAKPKKGIYFIFHHANKNE